MGKVHVSTQHSPYDAMRLTRRAHATTLPPRVTAETWGDTLPW